MFTGLVEGVGEVIERKPTSGGFRLRIAAALAPQLASGDSIAVNGVCLTVIERRPSGFVFEIGPETLSRTALGHVVPGDPVNLERPLRFGGALGGHLVLGHVDGVGTVDTVTRVESTARVRVMLPSRDLEPLLIPQGSVAVDGVSLTVAALGDRSFEVMLIPHTLAVTTLGRLKPGQAANNEADVIGKYLVRSLALRGTT
jgi:riboflavin synthase alpha subunit